MIQLGISILTKEKISLIRGRRIGLITNHTGVDQNFRSNIDLITEVGGEIAALFSPEHGIFGTAPDGKKITSSIDDSRKIPIHSLYGENRQPTAEMLQNIDLLIFDIQDVGSRFYTYISTLRLAIESAAKHGVDFIVLDRPNPIRGDRVEGNVLDQNFASFVGCDQIPIRHGMTIGELAKLFRSNLKIDLDLKIIAMKSWKREMWFDQTRLPFIPPSPNMPTIDTATLYPGFCLIEGTNVSEGRGTTKPFEWIGAPWMDAEKLISSLKLNGVKLRSITFTPRFSKFANENCNGVQIHINDRDTAKPIEIAIRMIEKIAENHSDQFKFRESFFDKLAGTDQLRLAIENGKAEDLLTKWQNDLNDFCEKRRSFLIYDRSDFIPKLQNP